MCWSILVGRVYKECKSNEDDIFDNVLTFECRGEEALPCHRRDKKEGHYRGGHVKDEEPECDFFATWNQKEEADEHFEEGKPNDEIAKRPKRHRSVEKVGHHWVGGTEVKEF